MKAFILASQLPVIPLALLAAAGPATAHSAIAHTADAQASESTQLAPDAPTAPAEQRAIEGGLIPAVIFAGEETQPLTIEERMASQGVSALSVAVMRGGELHWRRFYGSDGGGADTLFQAASMSKAVASVGIVALAQERGVSLDADISPDLAGLLQLVAINPHGAAITLRGLLSHTNGTSVSGFPGYAAGEPIPTTLGVVLGAGGANTAPVIVDPAKIGQFNYSGGGSTIAQLWAEKVSGESFEALMRRLVLDPIGMKLSSFTLAPPSSDVARALDGNSRPVEGGWNTYPESAAAGLWTTPSDYARFAHALARASKGDASAGIEPAVAAEVLKVVDDDYALGVGVTVEDGGEIRFGHGGANRGYRSQFHAYPARDEVIVVMTNAPGGRIVLGDINRAAQLAYGWPGEGTVTRERHQMSDAQLSALAGEYAREGDDEPSVTLSVFEGELRGLVGGDNAFRMVPVGPETFIDPDQGREISIRQEGGRTVMETQGLAFVRR